MIQSGDSQLATINCLLASPGRGSQNGKSDDPEVDLVDHSASETSYTPLYASHHKKSVAPGASSSYPFRLLIRLLAETSKCLSPFFEQSHAVVLGTRNKQMRLTQC